MAETTQPLLELKTLTERRTLKIDGAPYEVLNPGELPILEYNRIAKRSLRIAELLGRDDPSDEEVAEMGRLLDYAVRVVLVAPPEVHTKLTEPVRLGIFNYFSGLVGETAATLASELVAAREPARDESGTPTGA